MLRFKDRCKGIYIMGVLFNISPVTDCASIVEYTFEKRFYRFSIAQS